LEELIIYFSYCVISINNILLVMICQSFLEISGFLRNKFNLYFLFNFPFYWYGLTYGEDFGGKASIFAFIIFFFWIFVGFMLAIYVSMLIFYFFVL
jgi:hypothetical protein